jgi:2-dehydro-3-deoxygluconokinase
MGAERLDLVTIGETMLRLATPVGVPLERATELEVEVAGAESNVAVAFSRLGYQTGWVSRLPANAMGRLVVNRILEHRVDVSRVLWADRGSRLGLYYWEANAPPRPGRVIYDRADSAFARIDADEVDWPYIRNARWLHLTGITPVLSDSCRRLVERALDEARRAGQAVSFDLNYRATLWPADEAAASFREMLEGVRVLFVSSRDTKTLFGLDTSPEQQAMELAKRFKAEVVAVTLGSDGAVACENGRLNRVRAFQATEIDRLGRGDAFVAGFLHGMEKSGAEAGLRYGAALAALKQTYRGDIAWTTAEELEAVVNSGERQIER